VPVAQGVLNGAGFSNFSLSGLQPVLNMALTLVNGRSAPNTRDLTFDIQDVTTTPNTAKDGDIYLANPDESGQLKTRDPSGTVASVLQDDLPKCFLANADKISFVFASVFMDPQIQSWLKPTATGISYFQSSDGATQAVAIKTITQSPWGPGNLSTAVDPSLFSPGGSLSFALSEGVFMKNLLLPAIPQAIGQGVTVNDFQFNGPAEPIQQDNCSITNVREFDIQSVENAGTYYYPKITSFRVVINNNQLITTASGKFDITGLAGAWVAFNNLQVVNQLHYDPASQRIVFTLVSKVEPSVDKHIPWEYWLLGIGGLILLLVPIIINIVVTVVDNAVQSALTGEGNLAIVSIPPSTAIWTGVSKFDIDQASLAEALVING